MKNTSGTKLIAIFILSGLNAVAQNMLQDGNFALDTSLNNPVLNGPLNPGSPWTISSSVGTLNGVGMIPLPDNTLAPADPLTAGSPDRGVGRAPYFVAANTTETFSQNVNGFVSGNIYEVSFDAYLSYFGANNPGVPGFNLQMGSSTVVNFTLAGLSVSASPSDVSGWTHFYGIFVAPNSGSFAMNFNFIANYVPSNSIVVDRFYIGPLVSKPLDLECPPDIVAYTCSNCATVNFAASAKDVNCSPGLTNTVIHYELNGTPIDTSYCFPPGVSTVQVIATNACPNSNTCNFTVTVIQVTNPPVIFSYPTNITICISSNGCGIMPDDTWEIQVGSGMTVTQSIPPGTLVCSATNVTFSVSSPCGDVVQTNVPCTLINCASNCLQIQCWTNPVVSSCTNVPVYYNPTAIDTCCSNWMVVCTPSSGSLFSPGTTSTVNCVATDACGNSNSCSFTVTVLLNTNPPVIISCPAAVTICMNSNGCGVMPDDTSEVQAGGSVTVTQSIPPGTLVCSATNVTFSVMDPCGNVSQTNVPCVLIDCSSNSCLQIQSPGNIVVATCSSNLPVYYCVMATDACCTNCVASNSISPAGVVLIPAGAFNMGDSLDGEIDATPVVSVNVSAFYAETNLVSYGLWQSVYNWATGQGYGFDHPGSGKAPDHPVQTMNWWDAVKWCNARSQLAGLTPAYYSDAGLTQVYKSGQMTPYVNWSANGYRLPTEAEWEKAARGGLSGLRFPWGDTISESQANYYADPASVGGYSYDLSPIDGYISVFDTGGFPYTSPVGSFAPNEYCLYDMAGNVEPWCWDWYAGPPYPAGSPYLGGNDPKGPATGTQRILRGGGWDATPFNERCCQRNFTVPGDAINDMGIRCVIGAAPTNNCFTIVTVPPSGYDFPLGTTTVTSTVTDNCGNSNSCTFTVTVVPETNPPVIFSCPTNIILCSSNGCGVMIDATSEVQATNAAGAKLTVVQSILPGTLVCNDTNVTFSVTDPCGNVAQTNVPCTLVNCASNNCLRIQCWTNMVVVSCSNVPVYYNPTAIDTCCSNWALVCTPPSGSVFLSGTTNTVSCVVTDACGNSNGCSFTVTVNCGTNFSASCGCTNYLTGNLFVSANEQNFGNGDIYEITLNGGVQSTFATGLNEPFGIAFNSAGNLMVADCGSGNIYEFKPDGTRSTFASGLSNPMALAIDSHGNVFVSEVYVGDIIKITPGGVKTTFATGLNFPQSLLFDKADNLFEGDWASDTIFKFSPGGAQSTFAAGMGGVEGLAFDSAGNLYATANGDIVEITPGGVQSIFTTSANNTDELIFDNAGNLYLSSVLGNGIYKYPAGGGGAVVSFTGGVVDAYGLAIQPAVTNCINLTCPTNIQVTTCSGCIAVIFAATATDQCCNHLQINYALNGTPIATNYCFPLGTNTVQVTASDCCSNLATGSFTVTVTACSTAVGPCCGPGLGPQTIHWLPFPTNGAVLSDPSGTNPQGSWWVTNLPCYGKVLVTQNFPDGVFWFLNPNLAGVPNGNGTFNFTDSGYGPYSWGTAAWMNFLAANQDNYTVRFYFLNGPPNPCDVVLGVTGLGANTTAVVSQPVTFRTEYDLNSPLSDNTFSAETKLDGIYGPPIAGSIGTSVGSAYYQTTNSGDGVNTGWAVLQPVYALQTTNLAAGSVQGLAGLPLNNLPYLSLNVSQQPGDGIGFTVGYICCTNKCLQVQGPANIQAYSCTNVALNYPLPIVEDPCCGTNWSVVFNPPSGTSFAPGKDSLVDWYVYDCSGTNIAASGSFWVTVLCTNCCTGPLTNYTVTVVQGSNYLADCLCQGTNDTLADILPSVPVGTEVYFWNPAAGQFTPPDTFMAGGWQNGTEPLVPGEGFLLVSFTNQYSLTIYGCQPGCGGGCSPLTCGSDALLVGDYGLNPNPAAFCDLFCCPPIPGTEVQVWDAASQSFTAYAYGGAWSPLPGPPPLPVGYSEFVSVEHTFPVINCPAPIVTNACTPVRVSFSVGASNTYGGNLTASANPSSGSLFNVGTTIVNCTVTNACGLISTCSFTVTVNCPICCPIINIGQSNGVLTFTWPVNQGWTLEYETNGLSATGWMTVTGALDGSYSITKDPTRPTVFYRLKYP